MNIDKLTKGAQIIAIVCNQWGDTGKGKFSDYFAANWADVIARGTGGNNAGHTVVIKGKKRIFHLLPSGIINAEKINILGNGMAIDLDVLCEELNDLERENISYKNLMISEDAHVILPQHVLLDKKQNQSQEKGIGSTGRGIGPCYSDKTSRSGIKIRDLYDVEIFPSKIKKIVEHYSYINGDINFDSTKETNRIISNLRPLAEILKPYVKDTIHEIHKLKSEGKKILIEGAQGFLLSIEYGTYPYVTSSDCSINGTAAGIGLSARDVDLTLGIVKFPFMTRVGKGPFPTELGGSFSFKHCADSENNLKKELLKFEIPFKEINGKISYDCNDKKIMEFLNSDDEFYQGIGIRLAGGEYGATTGRPRRVGWTDLLALKYALDINGKDIILTKADVIRGMKEFKLAVGYDNQDNFTRDPKKLENAKAKYKYFRGFEEDISNVKKYEDLPDSIRESISFLEKFTGARVRLVSTGPEREQIIFKES